MGENQFTSFNRMLKSQSLQKLLDRLDDGTFTDFFDDWKWILSYSRRCWKQIGLYLIVGILSSTLGLTSSVASKYLIDIMVGRKMDRFWMLAVILVVSTVLSLLFSGLLSRMSAKLTIKLTNDIRSDVFSRILEADWMEVNRYASGDLVNRFNNDVSTVAVNAVSWGPSLIITLYHFTAAFCVILYYDVTMALIALASAPVLLIMSRYVMRKNKQYREKVLRINSQVMSFEVETFQNVDTIKSFGVADQFGRKLDNWQKEQRNTNLQYNLFQITTGTLTKLISAAVTFVAFGYCLFRLWSGDITFGTMSLFLQQRSTLSGQFQSLVGIIPGMLNSSVSAHRIRELMGLSGEHRDPEAARVLEEVKEDGLSLQMENVDFSYTGDTPVIAESDFIANPGEIVALVGPSGEGKTTMLRLILGLTIPQGGHVQIFGNSSPRLDISADIRQFISYVPQGNTILSGTVAENLRMVKEDATDDEIIEALKTACAWDFVSKHPMGIEMNVGERGKGLSEGQAQRIAIARAILRDAPILLLDEATSALDVATERQVLRNIITQRPNKTCIVTTHRPSVLNMCRRVYRVMDSHVRELSEEESSRMAMDF